MQPINVIDEFKIDLFTYANDITVQSSIGQYIDCKFILKDIQLIKYLLIDTFTCGRNIARTFLCTVHKKLQSFGSFNSEPYIFEIHFLQNKII
jgi:hypothetical protein